MKRRRVKVECPTPSKAPHRNKQMAYEAARIRARDLLDHGKHVSPIYGYECPCGKWHLTRLSSWEGEPHVLFVRIPDELQTWAMTKVTEA